MHLAVLSSPRSWYLDDLRRAAGGRHEFTSVTYHDLRSDAGPQVLRVGASGTNLNDADAVLVRSMQPGSLEQIVFRMDALRSVENSGTPVVNPPVAVETAVDKYLTTARLVEAGLAVPRTAVCQTVDAALQSFDALGGDVVIKPLFGSEGRGITRVSDRELAERAFRMLVELRAVIYLQEFVEHEGFDIRALVIGEELFAMRRRSTGDWRTNIRLGAMAEPARLSAEETELARRAAAAVGAPLAGVDLLPARDGRMLVVEVNAVPGWKALAEVLQIDVAARVLDYVERIVEE